MSKQSDLINITQGDTITVDHTSGNVGIGTTSPDTALHIQRTDFATLKLEQTNTSGSQISDIVGEQNGTQKWRLGKLASGSDDFTVQVGTTERMRIQSNGQVLYNTTGAIASGVMNVQVGTGDLDVGIRVRAETSGNWGIAFKNSSGTDIGNIVLNASSVSYNTSSDYRLKEDWQPMVGASERVLNLKPVNFAWKADGSRVDGFLAHELAEVIPEAATGTKDEVDEEGTPVYQGIDQSKLVPLLTAALQEALTEIADLKVRVTTLEEV